MAVLSNTFCETATIKNTLLRLHADNFSLTETALRRLVRDNNIPSVKIGKKHLLYCPNVIAYLTNGHR